MAAEGCAAGPLGRDTLQWLGRLQAAPPTLAKVHAAIERLRRAGPVARAGARGTVIDDPLLADHLLADHLPAMDAPDLHRRHICGHIRGHTRRHNRRRAPGLLCWLLLDPAEPAMATVTRAGGALSLELDGLSAGGLRSAQPASLRVEPAPAGPGPEVVVRSGVRVVLGEMVAQADLVEPGPLVDWLQAVLAGDLSPRDGAVLQSDFNGKLLRRIGFRGARMTALAWPALDASAARQPFTLGLRWLAEAVDDAPTKGQARLPATSRRKPMLTSNFRLAGLPFGADLATRVELPAVDLQWTGDDLGLHRRALSAGRRTFGEAVVTLGMRQADAARSWVQTLVSDGRVDDSEGLALRVDLLDATLKTVLASVDLGGCLLRGMDEDPIAVGANEVVRQLRLRFAVASLKLSLA